MLYKINLIFSNFQRFTEVLSFGYSAWCVIKQVKKAVILSYILFVYDYKDANKIYIIYNMNTNYMKKIKGICD